MGKGRPTRSSDNRIVMLSLICSCLLTAIVVSNLSKEWMNVQETSSKDFSDSPQQAAQQIGAVNTTTSTNNNHRNGLDPLNILAIPYGTTPNLPSIRVENETMDKKRAIYGGAGDKGHLGGFTEFDIHGVSPTVWKHMIQNYGIKSVLDVGCGRGISTLWFLRHGLDILCAEGSHDAVEKSMLPDPSKQVVEHDFARGPWWPEKTYDAAWSVEFLEHVGRQYHFNYIAAFRKCALLFVTSSRWGGWHHVEVHDDEWWITKYESYGFRYHDALTKEIRKVAHSESQKGIMSPTGENYCPQHIFMSMKVFVNPAVASLPQHAHLFPEEGCFERFEPATKTTPRTRITRKCGTGPNGYHETPLPESFHPITLTQEMDQHWYDEIRQHLFPNETITIHSQATSS